MSDDQGNDSGGRTLGGGPAEQLPSGWGSNRSGSGQRIGRIGQTSNAPAPRSGGIATLRDFASSGPPRGRQTRPHADDSDDDEDGAPEAEGESWFAGGERSAISVENPDRPSRGGVPGLGTVRDILRKAQQGGPPPPEAQQASQSNTRGAFLGGGHTLGSDDIESSFVPDPNATSPTSEADEEAAVREITFWRDGFSIQNGPLMRYDDPANQRILDSINSGNAPPSVLNVRVGQPVELRVSRRITEDYVPPPKVFAAFEGSGNRLGAPGPSSQPVPGAFPGSSTTVPGPAATQDPEGINTKFEVDMSKPTTSLQIRLADGTRIVSRMNLTHTVGDIRNFINASRPGFSSTPYTIGTTFPNRTLEDMSQTIEAAGLANSVIVQRWA